MVGSEPTEVLQDRAEQARRAVPGSLRAVMDAAARHQTLVLAAGLAFFGLLSLAPAVGVAMAVPRVLVAEETVSSLVDVLGERFGETLGLGDLLEQMEDRAGRYAGIGLLVLLWPATTLASGWRRALDAVYDQDTPPGVRGLVGRVKGLALGMVLLAGLLVLLAAIVATAVMPGEQHLLVVLVALGAVGLQFGFCLLVYRLLPAGSRPWSQLWPGAVWATAGVVGVTVVFAVALWLMEDLADHYPPALSTAVVLGVWLYGANLALLLGAELNAQRYGGEPTADAG